MGIATGRVAVIRLWFAASGVILAFVTFTGHHASAQRLTYLDRPSDVCRSVGTRIRSCERHDGIDIRSVRVWYDSGRLEIRIVARHLTPANTDNPGQVAIATPKAPWPGEYRLPISSREANPRRLRLPTAYASCPRMTFRANLARNAYRVVVPRWCLGNPDKVEVSVRLRNVMRNCRLRCVLEERYDTFTSPWVDYGG
jgi:hypothetical protein